jgi:hypothetical protein
VTGVHQVVRNAVHAIGMAAAAGASRVVEVPREGDQSAVRSLPLCSTPIARMTADAGVSAECVEGDEALSLVRVALEATVTGIGSGVLCRSGAGRR